jgi:hypothetical protein
MPEKKLEKCVPRGLKHTEPAAILGLCSTEISRSASFSGSICLLGTNLGTKPFQIDQNQAKPERAQGSVSSSKSKSFKLFRRFSKSG